jgi:hypothetical protein
MSNQDQDYSTQSNRNLLEENRRFITTDVVILDTLLFDLINQRAFPTQRRNTARAVATRLRERAEALRLLLRESGSTLPVPDTIESVIHTTNSDSDSYETASSQHFHSEQLGDTSVAAFRAAIRAEAVELAVNDLIVLGNIGADISNFHDLEDPTLTPTSNNRLIVESVLRRHFSSVLLCRYSSFSELVRLVLALRRSRHNE